MIEILNILLILAVLLIWVAQLREIVLMRDEAFDGRNDKLIWFLIIFFGSIFGAIAFIRWKNGRLNEKQLERKIKSSLNDPLQK